MDPSVSNYIEFSLLLFIVLVLFASARHVAIYGMSTATNWALGIGIVTSLMCGMYFQGKVPPQTTMRPTGPAALRPDMAPKEPIAATTDEPELAANYAYKAPKEKEAAMRSSARSKFLLRGEIVTYPLASGESVRFEPSERDIAERVNYLSESSRDEIARRAFRERQLIWLLAWIPVVLLGYIGGRLEFSQLVTKYRFSRTVKPQTEVVKPRDRIVKPHTYAEVEGFVGLLQAACEEPEMNSTLQTILEQPDAVRQTMIRDLLVRFEKKGAPQILSEAFICLMDNEVAEKVYVYIHRCERPLA